MENLNGPFLFESMYAEDVEGSKLACLPGVGELLETYPSIHSHPTGPGCPGETPSTLQASGQRGPELRHCSTSGALHPVSQSVPCQWTGVLLDPTLSLGKLSLEMDLVQVAQ